MLKLWIRIIIGAILITLAISNLQGNNLLPAVGCLLLASLLIFKPEVILIIPLLILVSIALLITGILQAIMEYKLTLRETLKNPSYAQKVADAETLKDKIYWLLRNGPMCLSYMSVELSAPAEDIRAILQEMEQQKFIEQVSAVGVGNTPDEIPWRLLHW